MGTNVDALIAALDREGALGRTLRMRPDGNPENTVQFSYFNASEDNIERVAKQYPSLRDPLACVVLGALPVEIPSERRAIPMLRAALGNAHATESEIHSFVLRAYSHASEDLAHSAIDVRRMIINTARQLIETAQDTPDAYHALLHLLENPPPAVVARPENQHAHRLHMATVVFRHPRSDPQTRLHLAHTMADAIDALADLYTAKPRVENSPEDATCLASSLGHIPETLPLLNRLIGFSTWDWNPHWSLAYLCAIARSPIVFTLQPPDGVWVATSLYPLLREPLDELFHQRAFSYSKLDAAISNRLREGGYDVYWQFVRNILESPNCSSSLLRNLITGYMRRFPRSVPRMARVAAQQIQMTNPDTVKKFAALVAGDTDDEHPELLKMLPPRAHEALTTALRAKYREIDPQNKALRNTVAERLLASVYHLLPSTIREMSESNESPSAVWNALQTALGEPDRVLRAEPGKRARFQRWLDNARYEDFIRRLCASPDEI
jgi:hypothetical protein